MLSFTNRKIAIKTVIYIDVCIGVYFSIKWAIDCRYICKIFDLPNIAKYS